MIHHSAFRPIYLSARAVTAEVSGVAVSSSNRQLAADRRPRARRRLEVVDPTLRIPHAPHGSLLTASAGPSRCFCTSQAPRKASELPLESFHPDTSQNPYEARDHSHTFWPSPNPSPYQHERSPSIGRRDSRHVPDDPFHNELPVYVHQPPTRTKEPSIRSRTADDFFTSTVPRIDPNEYSSADIIDKKRRNPDPPLYIEALDPLLRNALLDHAMVLIKSGERSMPALLDEECFGQLTTDHKEQFGLSMLRRCLDDKASAITVWDLYDSWTQSSEQPYIPPSGPTRYALRNMQCSTLYRCCTYLRSENLLEQAAVMARDPRLKPSQSRFLLETLIFQLRPPKNLEEDDASDTITGIRPRDGASHARPMLDTASRRAFRSTLHSIVTSMRKLMASGVSFKRESLQLTLKMLCISRSHRDFLQLFASAQLRAQLEAAAVRGEGEGHNSVRQSTKERLPKEEEDEEIPPIISTKSLERLVVLLSTQHASGLRTAFELVQRVPAYQRTRLMYDHLMKMYGSVPIETNDRHRGDNDARDTLPPISTTNTTRDTSISSIESVTTIDAPVKEAARAAVRYKAMDTQLWQAMSNLPHLQGPTVHTISSRIECHARGRRWDLIQSDIQYLRKQKLGTIKNLSENAQMAILRCGVETGSLLAAHRLASLLLSGTGTASRDVVYRTNILNTLLVSAQRMQLIPPITALEGKAVSSIAGSSPTDRASELNAGAQSHLDTGTPDLGAVDRRPARRQPSRTQLLKRFLNHFTGLLRKHPALHPTMKTLQLLIQLLTKNHIWVSTPVLWNMVQIVCAHFDSKDRRSVPILEAFAHVFASRQDEKSKRQVLDLIKDIEASTCSSKPLSASKTEPQSHPDEVKRQS